MAPLAERALARLPEKVAAAIVEFMLGPLLDNPRRVAHGLRRELEDLLAARRGAFQVFYELDDPSREVRVHRIDHRDDVYRRR